jgi:hypothetical protein
MGAVFTELFFGTAVLEWFVNITLGSADEVAGDATQVQSTDERNQIDRIRVSTASIPSIQMYVA